MLDPKNMRQMGVDEKDNRKGETRGERPRGAYNDPFPIEVFNGF